MSTAPTQLLIFEFGPDAVFEGHLTGALERVESGGTLRVLAVLFALREAGSGALVALARHGDGVGGLTAALLDFRLDAEARRRATAEALQGELGDVLRAVGARLEPGGALAAILVEHRWAEVLADAARRAGGTEARGDLLDAEALARTLSSRGGRP